MYNKRGDVPFGISPLNRYIKYAAYSARRVKRLKSVTVSSLSMLLR